MTSGVPIWLALAVSFLAQLCTSHGDFVVSNGEVTVHCKTKLYLCGDDFCGNNFSDCDDGQTRRVDSDNVRYYAGQWIEVLK